MSLVSLSSVSDNIPFVSSSREPFNFTNHFPQPMVIEPDSEVCLTNITFSIPSGSSGYFIKGSDDPASTGGNNKLIFSFGDVGYCGALDVAVLKAGDYTGAELAVEIARAMNEINRFRYYTFSCVFVAGNPVANPPTEDTFTISYTETGGSLETASGGTWGEDALNVVDDTIITTATHNHFANGSVPYTPKKVACPDVPQDPNGSTTAFADSKGMVLYTQGTGLGEIGGCGFTDCTFHAFGDGSSATAAPQIEEKTFGIASPLQVGSSSYYFGNELDEDGFNKNAMEFKVETYVDANADNILKISYALPVAYDQPPADDEVDTIVLRKINLAGILTACTDVLLVRVVAVYRTRAYLVQLYKNNGAGGEFSQVVFSTGGNNDQVFSDGSADNKAKVYQETMNDTSNGVAPHPIIFGGVVYSTLGVPTTITGVTPYGTGAADARVSASVLNNAYTQSIVCPIPTLTFKRNTEAGVAQNVITDFNLGSDAGDSPSTYEQNIQGLTTADNTYTIQFNNDTNNGYDGTISIAVAPLVTDDSEVPTTETNGLAYKKTTREITKWTVYQDNNTPQNIAASLGTITITPNSNSITIHSTSFANGNPFLSTLVGDAPRLITEPIFAFVGLTENPVVNIMSKNNNQETFSRYDYYMPANSPSGNYEEDNPSDRVGGAQQASSGTARSNGGGGSFLDEVLCLRLGKITQEDIDEVGDGAFRRLGVEEYYKASVGETIGFNKNTYQVDIPTRTITSDIKPYTDLILEKTLSVSLPELSNVKSLEGESSQRYKTIKVIPFDSFTRSDEIKSLVSYEAPYEDWIKINNGRETQINQLTLQLRKPDGKLSDYVKGECRATIKFRESPEKRQERMFDRLAEKMTQIQNPAAEILVKANTFVGS